MIFEYKFKINNASLWQGNFSYSQPWDYWTYYNVPMEAIPLADSTKTKYEKITHSNIQFNNEKTSGSVTISVPVTNEIAQMLRTGKFADCISIQINAYQTTGDVGTVQPKLEFIGRVRNCKYRDLQCDIECTPITDVFNRNIVDRPYSKMCEWALYDSNCGVSMMSHEIPITITSISPDGLTIGYTSTTPIATNHIKNGLIGVTRIKYGLNYWWYGHVMSNTGSSLTLLAGIDTSLFEVGGSYFVYPGCNKQYNGDCLNKYANTQRFGGFPYIPILNPFERLN